MGKADDKSTPVVVFKVPGSREPQTPHERSLTEEARRRGQEMRRRFLTGVAFLQGLSTSLNDLPEPPVGDWASPTPPDKLSTAPAKPKRRFATTKFDLVLEILADIKGLPSDLSPAEIERKVLPEFRRRWAKLRPDDDSDPPVERTTINRAYQEYIKSR